jgi:hypothetical protein
LLREGRKNPEFSSAKRELKEMGMAQLVSKLAFAGILLLGMPQSTWAADASQFEVDPHWPKPLPNNWITGQIAGIYVDSQDHVWINHRRRSLTEREIFAATMANVECCFPAPEIIEFDLEGNVVNDGIVLKFTRDGQFVMQVGRQGGPPDSQDTSRLSGPSDMIVDPATNELYVSDGYNNRRVIVFDAATSEFKRMLGAYGNVPADDDFPLFDPDAPPAPQFSNPVHCVRMSRDGQVFVCDRGHNRLQVFNKDGSFVREYFIHPHTRPGSVGSVMLWPDAEQSLLLTSDDSNGKIRITRLVTAWKSAPLAGAVT